MPKKQKTWNLLKGKLVEKEQINEKLGTMIGVLFFIIIFAGIMAFAYLPITVDRAIIGVVTALGFMIGFSILGNTMKKRATQSEAERVRINTFSKEFSKPYYKGRYDEAIEACNRRLKEDPNDILALDNLDTVYLVRGQYENSLKVIKNILDMKPEFPEIWWYNSANIYFKKQNYNKANESLDKILKNMPNSPIAKKLRYDIQRALKIKHCLKCGAENKKESIYCIKCGKLLG